MSELSAYLGDLYDVLPLHWAGVAVVVVSLVCGLIVGAEREAKQKAAGLRTLMLICVGSTVFTLGSVLLAGPDDDRTRIAAQVVTGVGFLGAGAIIRHRGTVIGLTTGASIWTVAAIGVLVGGGYAAAGVVLTVMVVTALVLVAQVERRFNNDCQFVEARFRFQSKDGKTWLRMRRILDDYHVPDDRWSIETGTESDALRVRYCDSHRSHRAMLYELAEVDGVVEVRS